MCFPVNIAKSLRTPILTHLRTAASEETFYLYLSPNIYHPILISNFLFYQEINEKICQIF